MKRLSDLRSGLISGRPIPETLKWIGSSWGTRPLMAKGFLWCFSARLSSVAVFCRKPRGVQTSQINSNRNAYFLAKLMTGVFLLLLNKKMFFLLFFYFHCVCASIFRLVGALGHWHRRSGRRLRDWRGGLWWFGRQFFTNSFIPLMLRTD